MKCLTIKNIAYATGGIICNEQFDQGREIGSVVIDSRRVTDNCLFIAIKGERTDGHNFVNQAFEMGASVVLVERKPENINNHPYIIVKSTLEALRRLAEYYRSVLNVKVIGITGSVGKTSTKEFIASVLAQKYKILKTEGNFNNEIGLPLTVFNIREEHEAAVLEMGISNFGEMTRLSKIAKPDICVITNIGLCHLENLGTRDGILKAKTEIFKYASPDYNTVLNGDDDKLSSIIPRNENDIYFYGLDKKNRIYADDIKLLGIEGSICRIVTPKGSIEVAISIPGKHMIYNAMAAAAVGQLMGLSLSEIKSGIEKLHTVGGRLNIINTGRITIIDDCYNANPVSAKSSVDVLENGAGRKVAILGDMFELGPKEAELHYEVGRYLAKKDVQAAVCVGTLSKNTYEGIKAGGFAGSAYYFENIEGFLSNKEYIIENGDTVLVKASHSMHFENIVNALK